MYDLQFEPFSNALSALDANIIDENNADHLNYSDKDVKYYITFIIVNKENYSQYNILQTYTIR